MLKVRETAKVFLNLFLLKGKPNAVPQSFSLLFMLCIFFILSKVAIYLWFIHIVDRFDPKDTIHITYVGASLIAIIWLLLLFATLRSTLLYLKILDRFLQIATAIVAMDCILNVIYLIWLSVLGYVDLPATGIQSVTSIAMILGFILMMYWQFMVYINILVFSMNITILKAGIFTLFYMLLQHNLAEILLNEVITVVMVNNPTNVVDVSIHGI